MRSPRLSDGNYRVKQIAIIGPGLIGGSFGLALKEKGVLCSRTGVSRKLTNLIRAKQRGAIDSYTNDLILAVKQADWVLIATALDTIPELFTRIVPHLKAKTLVMDVASVKRPLLQKVREQIRRRKGEIFYLSVHPLAGSEKTGIESAQGNLFSGHTCIFIREKGILFLPERVRREAERLWRRLGSRIIYLTAAEHDQNMAYTSHLPHLLAYSLVSGLSGSSIYRRPGCFPPSFQDLTRIADSPPDLWQEICLANQKEILRALSIFQKQLARLRTTLKSSPNRLINFLREANNLRRQFVLNKSK